MSKYLMALDQGTTSSRCILFDHRGKICSQVHREFTQHFPKDGWVEHDPIQIWETQVSVAYEAMLRVGATYQDIDAIGISNQRETVVVWEKATGKPIYNAIVWQCRRTAKMCDELKQSGAETMIREKTGLLVDPYFSATKLATTGGFLMSGNTTFIIGTEDERVSSLIEILREHSKKRFERIETVNVSDGAFVAPISSEIMVGGATVFVMNVERFEKI